MLMENVHTWKVERLLQDISVAPHSNPIDLSFSMSMQNMQKSEPEQYLTRIMQTGHTQHMETIQTIIDHL